jgi:hypothetical protein
MSSFSTKGLREVSGELIYSRSTQNLYFNQERFPVTAADASLFQRSHGYENYSVE